jgi:hypothetical protein
MDLPSLLLILLDIKKRSTAGCRIELYVVPEGHRGLLCSSLCYRALGWFAIAAAKEKKFSLSIVVRLGTQL